MTPLDDIGMTKDQQIEYLKAVLRAIAGNIEDGERALGYLPHPSISEAYGRATRALCVDFGEQYDFPKDLAALPKGPHWNGVKLN